MRRSTRTLAPLRAPLALALLGLAGCGVLGNSGPRVERSEDPRIQREVENRLGLEPSLDATGLRVQVDGAVVQLHGSVEGIGAWQCAITTAGLVRGVRTVVDYLVIQRGPRDVQCLAPRPDTALAAGPP